MFASCECCMLSGRGVSDGPFPCPEESYGLTVSLSVVRCNSNCATLMLVQEVRLSIERRH